MAGSALSEDDPNEGLRALLETLHARCEALGMRWPCVSGSESVSEDEEVEEVEEADAAEEPEEAGELGNDRSSPTPSDATEGTEPVREVAEEPRTSARGAWTKEEIRKVAQGYRRWGGQWREIAKTLEGRSDDAVRQMWCRRNEHANKTRAGPRGPTGPRLRWSASLDDRLRRGFGEYGKRWATIATVYDLDRSGSAVKSRAYRLGLIS